MILTDLSLVNYKNFESQSFSFDHKINCMVGNNGVGKTTVLDAVYHLAYGKSYFNPISSQNIRHGADFFVIDGNFTHNEQPQRILISNKKGQKKVIKRNGKAYERFSDHIGLIPVVIISPADRDLITEGSDVRRKFMDGVLSLNDPAYLQNLLDYNKVLSQRNSLLKYFALNNTYNEDTLGVYNEQLDQLGTPLHKRREEFIAQFTPIFNTRYQEISGGHEAVSLNYKSQLQEMPLMELFAQNLNKDKALQYTSQGIHKDDLNFQIDGHPIKKFGSQGQQKSFLIALKLAQFDFVKDKAEQNPILLLDDIFDKLDESRVAQLLQLVKEDNFGQIFISDTHAQRTEAVISSIHQSYKMIAL
ncbi:DNA replication/repair protein RecF [Gilvibacter sp.]|uniref:DNA replication/repair protein RecF n=1 Tax=Gilvibacter sp. TaxID=2729997 RepID=UPI0035BE415D